MEDNIYQKAYEWALTYDFEEIQIEYASKLTLKMLDNSCNMSAEERKIFFYVYHAITDRKDILLEDDINQLLRLARNRVTIFSKPEFSSIVHACKMEIIPTMEKKFMKRYKKLVRQNLGLTQEVTSE